MRAHAPPAEVLDPSSPAPPGCTACGAPRMLPFLRIRDVPVLVNRLWSRRNAAARAPTARVTLAYCGACGLIRNTDFDPALVTYSPEYENSLHFSPTFQRYARELAADLVQRHGLQTGHVLEIGAGQGEFLELLRGAGAAQVTGFDPAFAGGGSSDGPRIVADLFRGDMPEERPDLVCGRHVLEHVADVQALLASVHRAATGAAFYFEVPDARHLLTAHAIWDVIFEHCTYFTRSALVRVLETAGFHVRDAGSRFRGQYLFARGDVTHQPHPATRPSADHCWLARATRVFAHAYVLGIRAWNHRLDSSISSGERFAVWGAGSKGVMFLNTVPAARHAAAVIDVNPRKHGRHVPGTGHRIDPPRALRSTCVDEVLVMNPVYRDEIAVNVHDLGVDAALTVVGADPGPRLAWPRPAVVQASG